MSLGDVLWHKGADYSLDELQKLMLSVHPTCVRLTGLKNWEEYFLYVL